MLWELRKVLRVMWVSPVCLVNDRACAAPEEARSREAHCACPTPPYIKRAPRLQTCRVQVRTTAIFSI